MAMHPEIQQKAKKELDLVVGSDRLPTYDDYDSLPYIRAIFMECSRWLPVIPMGLPHRVTADEYYKEYFIPAGTIILAVRTVLIPIMYQRDAYCLANFIEYLVITVAI